MIIVEYEETPVNVANPKTPAHDQQTQIDPVGCLIGDVSRMIRTVYDRRVEPLGLTRGAVAVMTRLNRLKAAPRPSWQPISKSKNRPSVS